MVTSDGRHIRRELRHTLALSDRERLQFMERATLVKYAAGQEILAQLERLFEAPKRPRAGNMLIVGEPHNGKTTLITKFHQEHGTPVIEDDAAVKPIVVAEAPPVADEKSLHTMILERFHAPFGPTAPAAQLRLQTLHILRECRTRMLIIDELHSMTAGSARKQMEVMNTIKMLCNELQIPIVGVGTELAVNMLRTDPQHVSRFRVERLPMWRLDQNFQRLVVDLEATLPLKQPSNLGSKETAVLLHKFCKGSLGYLRDGLVQCAREAIEKGTEQITPELIKRMKRWFEPTAGIPERGPEAAAGPYR